MNEFTKVENYYFSGDYDSALSHCVKCVNSGNVKCIRFMGWFYYTGNGVDEDLAQALEWFKKAADKNDAESFFGIGAVYYRLEKFKESFKQFQKSAKLGFTPAILRLGIMSKSGHGVDKDLNAAYEYYSLASDKGNLVAKRLIVRMLFEGYKGWFGRLRAFPKFAHIIFIAGITGYRDKHDQNLMW